MTTPPPLKIVIVGLGYVGVTAAACISSQGHSVIGVDVNEEKVQRINDGESPIVEPEVGDHIAAAVADGRLRASSALPKLDDVDLIVVCVGTPSAVDGSHNMTFIAESTRQIARAASQTDKKITVAFRSTFRPGTTEDLIAPIFREIVGPDFSSQIELVYNPEFLRESTAVADYFRPPKIVIGTDQAQQSSVMDRLHDGIDAKVFVTGFREAEITKFVDNSWHAVKVAFANEVGRICAAYGVESQTAHQIFISDTKLNISAYYTRPGGAFGGSCLPKDVRAMQHIAEAASVETQLIASLLDSNGSHKRFQLSRVVEVAVPGSRILVAGLAFKAGTDDLRESPNVLLVAQLLELGFNVRIYDPYVHTSALVGQNLGHIMTELPSLRELLITDEEIRSSDFDLVVINNASSEGLAIDPGLPVVDLRTISPREKVKS